MRCIALVLGLGLFLFDSATASAEPKREDVAFPTIDQVDLKGVFYPPQGPGSGANSPCVMMVHRYGSDRTKGDWDGLAVALQEKGYAVLSFDLRGHGKSKELRDKIEFWKINMYPYNKLCGGKINDQRIDATKFSKAYFPWLINDIAAARRFLDEQNDANGCNTKQIFVIAERDMAAQVLLWAGWETLRPGIAPTQLNPNPTHKGSDDLAGLVFLSIDKRPLALTMPYEMSSPIVQRLWFAKEAPIGTPLKEKQSMCFINGATDTAGAANVKFFYSTLFAAEKVDKKDQIKYQVTIPETKLLGIELVGKKGLGTDDRIFEYLEAVKKRRGNAPPIKRNVADVPLIAVDLRQIGYP